MATSLVHRVAFPTVKNPSKAKVDRISQIEFSIHCPKGPDRNLIEIWGFNNLIPEDSDNPYVWRTMPSAYTIYLNRAFFRLENLKYAVDHAKGDQKVMLLLKHHLLHLDTTLDKVWEEAREADINDEMNANWRSKTLDQWLTIDFYIQRHNVYDIDAFIEEEAGSIEKLKMDPFDLGVLSIIFYCC
jgi:hypothetical protein